jgi:polyhydroxybutyrate depolymerase
MKHKSAVVRVCSAVAAWVFGLVCSPWPVAAQDAGFGERTVAVDGIERSYTVHMPPRAASPAPVVLIFHGGGGRPQAIANKTGMNDLADQYGFIAVYPAGAERASGRGGTWNIGGPSSPSSANDVAFVQALLGDLERNTPIDHARIYATGLSMGGIFSYRLACEMSNTFAAIAPVSATMVEPSCHPRSPVAVLHIHGTDDNRIPLNGGRGEMTAANRSWPAPQQGLSLWSRLDGCSAQPARGDDGCSTYGQCKATVEFCVIPGAGHGWPDGTSARIWEFFAAHPKGAV